MMRFSLKIAVVFGLVVVFACATKSPPPPAELIDEPGGDAAKPSEEAPVVTVEQPRVTLKLEQTTLGETVRAIGEAAGGSLVVMNGVETRPVGPVRFTRDEMAVVAKKLAGDSGCMVQDCGAYIFLYPLDEHYAPLETVSMDGLLNGTFERMTGGMAFGSGLQLYAVCAWVSYAKNITLITDNVVSDNLCGELVLDDIPLAEAIEAVLKSARIHMFDVESTDEFIFIRAKQNVTAASQLLNADQLTEQQRRSLMKRVNVVLPKKIDDGFEMTIRPAPLRQMLPVLSKQLGVRIEADPSMYDFPVNPCVMNGVQLSTALDLLIRQWPVPEFGYEVLEDRIVIRRRPPKPTEVTQSDQDPEPEKENGV